MKQTGWEIRVIVDDPSHLAGLNVYSSILALLRDFDIPKEQTQMIPLWFIIPQSSSRSLKK